MGTNSDYFEYYQYGQSKHLSFARGQAFADVYDAVIGADVARTLDYQVGDEIIIAHGLVVKNSLDSADILARESIGARVVNMHTIKPIDRKMILRCALETGAIITVEEHNIIGGLGSAVAEVLAEDFVQPVLFKRLGLNELRRARMKGSSSCPSCCESC